MAAENQLIGRARRSLTAAARGLALSGLSIGASLALLIATTLSLAFIPLGLGLFTTPYVLRLVRAHADLRRQLTRDWGGLPVGSAYRTLPSDRRRGLLGEPQLTFALLKDPATWRDLQWILADTVAGFLTALLPAALLAEAVFGVLLAAGLWSPVTVGGTHTYWYLGIPVNSSYSAVLAGVVALIVMLLTLMYGYRILHLHFLLSHTLLSPTQNQRLSRRVEALAETRHDALDSSAAELRRIERDLHDGAQARLVAMGMSLGAIEALLEKDPGQAKKLLAEARQSSAETLQELRDLVRGIHPPVLAERGLGDAARALALRMRVPVETEVDLPERFEEPVESAAYFAISEMLTNAAKYAEAERIWLDVYYTDEEEKLRIVVTDDGRGGVDPGRGTGIHGIERRLAAFDGLLVISSPPGGPTRVAMEIPCAPVTPGGQQAGPGHQGHQGHRRS